MKRILVLVIVLGLAVLAVPSAVARNADDPKVIDPNSVAYGRTYSEWSAAWWQWALSIPSKSHPLFDNGDCSVGQSGPVWFLGGKFCATYQGSDCGTNNVVRSCSVPAGKALYIPILNGEWTALERQGMGYPNEQIDWMRADLASAMDGSSNELDIDGKQIRNLLQNFRVQSPATVFTIPDDNLWLAIGEPGTFPGGAYFPLVDDGVYVMFPPLRAGSHKIHFHGYMPAYSFTLDVTYNLTVAGK